MRSSAKLIVALVVGILAVSNPAFAGGPFAPQVRVQQSNYQADRATFKTQLTRQGSAPQSFRPATPPEGVTEVEFPSGDLKLKAWIGMPAERQEQMPVVIFLHGGFAFGADDFEMAAPYRKAGFVVMTPILRGENGQAGNFSMFYDEVDDVLAAAAYIVAQPYADRARIFLAGHSVGGTMTLFANMASPIFKRAASFSGSPDQIVFTSGPPWNQILPFDRANTRELEMRSPLSYAASLKAPTRLYFGSQEAFFRETTA